MQSVNVEVIYISSLKLLSRNKINDKSKHYRTLNQNFEEIIKNKLKFIVCY